nr:Hsp70 family protein [Micromonospora sp. DSM 115978]
MSVAAEFRLAIDLGTCHTVAVARRDGQAPRAVLLDGSPTLPTGVFVAGDGAFHTGRDAARLALAEPDRFEPHPKRRIDEPTVLLGDAEPSTPALLASVLRRVAHEAWQGGVDATDATVLTHPAGWGPTRREVLAEAARRAGLGRVALVAEPVAAAAYCLAVLSGRVPHGRALVVFDFGGGTLDLTVVRREVDRLRVVATGGLPDLGGLDLDAALVGYLGPQVAAHDPDLWRRICAPAEPIDVRERSAFWAEVRAAKEMLSRTSTAPVALPRGSTALYLTRDELERVIAPLIDRAVDQTGLLLRRCGLAGPDLAGILLVGGSSRIPLVAHRLHTRLGVAPTVPEQPELPVAHGALLAPATDIDAPIPDLAVPGTAGPGTESPGLIDAGSASTPASARPGSGSWSDGPAWPTPRPAPLTPARSETAGGRSTGRARRRRIPLLAAAALIAVLAGTAGTVIWADRRGAADATGDSPTGPTATGDVLVRPPVGTEILVPAGLVACDDQFCPATPMCWGGLTAISGVAGRLSPVDCAQPHHWETFAAGLLPAEAVQARQDDLLTFPAIARVCSEGVRDGLSRDPADTRGWRIDAWPVPVGDGTWLFHCLSSPGTGEWTGFRFGAG